MPTGSTHGPGQGVPSSLPPTGSNHGPGQGGSPSGQGPHLNHHRTSSVSEGHRASAPCSLCFPLSPFRFSFSPSSCAPPPSPLCAPFPPLPPPSLQLAMPFT